MRRLITYSFILSVSFFGLVGLAQSQTDPAGITQGSPGGTIGSSPKSTKAVSPDQALDGALEAGILGPSGGVYAFGEMEESRENAAQMGRARSNETDEGLMTIMSTHPLADRVPENVNAPVVTGSTKIERHDVPKPQEDANQLAAGSAQLAKINELSLLLMAKRPSTTVRLVEPSIGDENSANVLQAQQAAGLTATAISNTGQAASGTKGASSCNESNPVKQCACRLKQGSKEDKAAGAVIASSTGSSSGGGLSDTVAYSTCAQQYASNKALGLATKAQDLIAGIGKKIGGKIEGAINPDGKKGTPVGEILGPTTIPGVSKVPGVGALGAINVPISGATADVAALINATMRGGALSYIDNPNIAITALCNGAVSKDEISVTSVFYGLVENSPLKDNLKDQLISHLIRLGSGISTSFFDGLTQGINGSAKSGQGGEQLGGGLKQISGDKLTGAPAAGATSANSGACGSGSKDTTIRAFENSSKYYLGDLIMKRPLTPNQNNGVVLEVSRQTPGVGISQEIVKQYWRSYEAFQGLFREHCRRVKLNYETAYATRPLSTVNTEEGDIWRSQNDQILKALAALSNPRLDLEKRWPLFIQMLNDEEAIATALIKPTAEITPLCTGDIDLNFAFGKKYIEEIATGKGSISQRVGANPSNVPAPAVAGALGEAVPSKLNRIVAHISLIRAFEFVRKIGRSARFIVAKSGLPGDQFPRREYVDILDREFPPSLEGDMNDAAEKLTGFIRDSYQQYRNNVETMARTPIDTVGGKANGQQINQ